MIRLVDDLLSCSLEKNPGKELVYEANGSVTYRTIWESAARFAAYLTREAGVSRGDRVVSVIENGSDAAIVLFGIWMAGAIAVPANTDLRGESLAYVINHSGASVVVSGRRFQKRVEEIVLSIPDVRLHVTDTETQDQPTSGCSIERWSDIIESNLDPTRSVRTIDIDPAAIIYTSGSTGRPKGVTLTHLNLVSNMHSIAEYLKLTSEDRVMAVLPLFYIYGLSLLLTHVLVGGSIVFDNRFVYPNVVLQNMIDRRVTGFAGVPSTFSMLLARSTLRDMDFPALRYVTQAGGAMPVPVQKEVAEVFAPAKLYVMYGATEAAPRLSYVEPEDLPQKWGSIGKPVPNVDLYPADSDGNQVPTGTEGELVARGSNIFAGYWRDPEGTELVLRDGLYFTGDLGMIDEDGFLYVTGRSKDIIKVKGFRVSPREIEERLMTIPGVIEVAVIGVADEILGEAPVAYFSTTDLDEPNSETLSEFCRRELPSYKTPVEFIRLESLPKGSSGKVSKQALKAQHEERQHDR